MNLKTVSHVQYVHEGRISAQYLDVLALHLWAGRNFSKNEDLPHGPETIILSYALWRSVFDGNRDVTGQAVLLKGAPYTIIGVLPENAVTPLNADLYTPLQASREREGQAANFQAILRLRDGANWQQANGELNRALSQSGRAQRLLKAGAHIEYFGVPLQIGQTSTLRPVVLGLMAAAGLILLIACANLAGLTLVHVRQRTSEISTRLALGASRWQIQRQLWIENLLLALVGGVAALGVGFLSVRVLLLMLPEHFLPVADVHLDNRVLLFTFSASLVTSVLFGMLPALGTGRLDLRLSMGSRTVARASNVRLRQGLIAGEVALTVVLLAAAGLLIRTLVYLETVPPGFNPDKVITAKASLDDVQYQDPAAFRKLVTESLAAMREIPGVRTAAVGLTLPYARAPLDSVKLPGGREVTTNALYVSPGYFRTLKVPVLAGREFTEADDENAQPVAIINQAFARKFFGATDLPIGRYLINNNRNLLIAGVVANTVLSSAARLNAGTAPLTKEEAIYVPAAQFDAQFLSMLNTWFQPSWVIRTAGSLDGYIAPMQRALSAVDPNLPFSGFYSMNDLLAKTLATQRIEVSLLAVMASLALLLSAVGIFALVASLIVQRTREIGIRAALGSTIHRTMIDIAGSAVGAAAAGLFLGLILCVGVLPIMRNALYGVGVYDVPTLFFVVLVLSTATLLSATIPALRVAAIDPVQTLREE